MDLKERLCSEGISCEQPFYDKIKHEVSRTDSRSTAIVFAPDLVTTKEGDCRFRFRGAETKELAPFPAAACRTWIRLTERSV
jgi:hypothetical protein